MPKLLKGQRDSIAVVYRQQGAKHRSKLRREAAARVLECMSLRHLFWVDDVDWPLRGELVDRHKHGGTLRVTGVVSRDFDFTFLGVDQRRLGVEPYLLPHTDVDYEKVAAVLGLDHGGENLWYFEIVDRAGGNELLAALQKQIVKAIGPYHLTRNGDCIRVRELGGQFGAGGNITIEYRARDAEHVTVAGLETYVKERGA